jgi:hypothetical protein
MSIPFSGITPIYAHFGGKKEQNSLPVHVISFRSLNFKSDICEFLNLADGVIQVPKLLK